MQVGQDRQSIWDGTLEWMEKAKSHDNQKCTRQVPCHVTVAVKDGEPELKADNWPNKLIMQLMPKQLISTVVGVYLRNAVSVCFHPQSCEALEALTKVMSNGYVGCVHFNSGERACDIKVLILLYAVDRCSYLGFIPNDQVGFVDRLRKLIQQQKSVSALTRDRQLGLAGNNPIAQPIQNIPLNPGTGPPPPNMSIANTHMSTVGNPGAIGSGGPNSMPNVIVPGASMMRAAASVGNQQPGGLQVSQAGNPGAAGQMAPGAVGGRGNVGMTGPPRTPYDRS